VGAWCARQDAYRQEVVADDDECIQRSSRATEKTETRTVSCANLEPKADAGKVVFGAEQVLSKTERRARVALLCFAGHGVKARRQQDLEADAF